MALGMKAFAQLTQLVGALCSFVEHEQAGVAVARSTPGEPLDVRILPPGFALTTEEVATKIVAALACAVSEEDEAVGVVFPAVRGEGRIEAGVETQVDGRAVCVAGRTPSGVGTVGLFRRPGGATGRKLIPNSVGSASRFACWSARDRLTATRPL